MKTSIFTLEITHEEQDEVSTDGIQECLINTFKIRDAKMFKRDDEFSSEGKEELTKCEFVDACKLSTDQEANHIKPWCNDLGSLDKSACYCIIRSKALKILGFDE